MDYKEKYEMALEGIQEILSSGEDSIKMSRLKLRLQGIFPELAESEDERIRKWIVDELKDSLHSIEALYSRDYDNRDKDDIIREDSLRKALAWLEKQGEQKSADKVEPKFKVGDWVVQEDVGTYKVVEVCESWYEVIDSQNNHYSIGFDKEYMCHLWTIQDAKKGDVLFYDSTCGFTFIYNGISPEGALLYSYVESNDGSPLLKYNIGKPNTGIGFATDKNIYPATKEQRDILFAKMRKAGYEWDTEKKELKKIEQKNYWSKEDERISSNINLYIRKAGDYPHFGKENIKEARNWMNALKDRVQPQPKQEWSEEDKKEVAVLEAYIRSKDWSERHVDRALGIVDELVNKVKSLSPQSQWKPSEEQMKALSAINVTGGISYAGQVQELINLYNDLKKLKD